jgi:hypothetical protein
MASMTLAHHPQQVPEGGPTVSIHSFSESSSRIWLGSRRCQGYSEVTVGRDSSAITHTICPATRTGVMTAGTPAELARSWKGSWPYARLPGDSAPEGSRVRRVLPAASLAPIAPARKSK